MSDFSFKKISSDKNLNFGELIKSLRIEKKLELPFIVKKLGIKEDYLLMIENDRLDLLPSGIYKKSFLKRYAEFLGLEKKLLAFKLEELKLEEKEDPFSKKRMNKNNLLVLPKILKTILFSLAILICFLYLAFYARKIFTPPELRIIYPEDNLLTNNREIEIVGETELEVEIKINAELVLNNQEGTFSQVISLKSGVNNITISAKKKYSKENIIIRQILVE